MIDSLRAATRCRITGFGRHYGPKALKFALQGRALIQVNDFAGASGAG